MPVQSDVNIRTIRIGEEFISPTGRRWIRIPKPTLDDLKELGEENYDARVEWTLKKNSGRAYVYARLVKELTRESLVYSGLRAPYPIGYLRVWDSATRVRRIIRPLRDALLRLETDHDGR